MFLHKEGMMQKKMSLPEILLAVLFAAVILVMALGVFFRYVLNNSLSWNIELSRYIFTWATFLGAVIAMRDGVHIRIDLLVDRVPVKVRRFLNIFNSFCVLAFSLFITVIGFELVNRTGGTVSAAMSLPLNYVYYLALPATFLLGCLYALRNLIANIKNTPHKTEEGS